MKNLFKKMFAIALVGVQFMPASKGMDFAAPVPGSRWVIEEPRVATADQVIDIVRLFHMIADANTGDSLSGIDFIRLIGKLGPFTQYRVDEETCILLNERGMPLRCYQFNWDGTRALRTASCYEGVTVEPILEIVHHGPWWLLDMVLDWLRGMRVEDGVIRDDEMPAAVGLNSGTRWMVALSDRGFGFERANGWKGAELMALNDQGFGDGTTLLHEAVRVTNAEMVKLLINRGASVNIAGNDVGSPLYELGNLIKERHDFINEFYPDHERDCKVNKYNFPFQCTRLGEELKAMHFLRAKGAKHMKPWGYAPSEDCFIGGDDFYEPSNEPTAQQERDIFDLFKMIAESGTKDVSYRVFLNLLEKVGPFTRYDIERTSCRKLNKEITNILDMAPGFDDKNFVVRFGGELKHSPCSKFSLKTVEPIVEIANHGSYELLDITLDMLARKGVENGKIRGVSMDRWVADDDKVAMLRRPEYFGQAGGRTLLHSAVEALNPEAVNLLLKRGADPNAVGKEEGSPLDLISNVMYEQHNNLESKGHRCRPNKYGIYVTCPYLGRAIKILHLLLEKGAVYHQKKATPKDYWSPDKPGE